MRRGDIYWAKLPEPSGKRPVLLVSRDQAYAVREKITVAEVSRTVRGISSEVPLGASEGLPQRCVVNADNLVTLPKTWLDKRVGALSRQKLQALDRALCFSLGVVADSLSD